MQRKDWEVSGFKLYNCWCLCLFLFGWRGRKEFGTTLGGAEAICLFLCSGVTPGSIKGNYVVPRIDHVGCINAKQFNPYTRFLVPV